MFLPVTRKYFLQIVCDGKNFFIRQEIQKYLEVKLATKQRELQGLEEKGLCVISEFLPS